MVSRSLEKMMLIAVGLSTAVIIGVPVLLYAINTMTYSTHLQDAQSAAEAIFTATNRIDSGELQNLTIQIHIPTGVTMTVNGNVLTITVLIDGQQTGWSESYDHQLSISPPTESGNYNMIFTLVSNVIQITHSWISL
ncbi:MAG: hypothetical protein OEV85_04195 [Candidatus Thorarchaeota archaeon]|nr:hypothetical protein [Candidatus Thorarchaeota archaeon]